MINLASSLTAVVALNAASGYTAWQLFQSLCPFVSAQSPPCLRGIPQQQQISQQQQIPQQQPPVCSDDSQQDVNGNCPINQQPGSSPPTTVTPFN